MMDERIKCPRCALLLDLIEEAGNWCCERCGILWSGWTYRDVDGLNKATSHAVQVAGECCVSEPVDTEGLTWEQSAIYCSSIQHPPVPLVPDVVEVTQDGVTHTFEVFRELKYTVKGLRGGE